MDRQETEIKSWQIRYQIDKEYWQKYYQENKERIADYARINGPKYKEENADYIRKYRATHMAKLRKESPQQRYSDACRTAIRSMVRLFKTSTRGRRSKYIGCSGPELRAHLQSKFEPNMGWDNYGLGGWYVAQIKPISQFPADRYIDSYHFTNLEPRWLPVTRNVKAAL